ncbi:MULTISPECIES: Bug family tripartite tricarboxylate transporter substrate binding protein [Variovorax]|jgi:tripartite-type tricarboxylate transporter receptor subunit TctC|uniref:Bug family tripartite tricarboxylate transporter substrate binding protein n=2 Tax=Comamonadaceae TaxID=80864 RepID=UPI00086E6CB5|nr:MULTISPECIES: tripartite tricarboxylate transporter substrate binding protein [Variovorax]ODV25307.1 MAG: ABC transporter substrate-binding protein [Variovorax sp. SCN 67-20]MBN8754691.1 tripartite tricarboxylate transporter substrate binding protein [Variovorax sp.]ODU19406.1 MAG: ABC transporter substrate-binding protein [Variovorax sp. SCN 67-85]OJZ03126.1 MAG: ABC transporter substrate-binding protein [Variovorax sp. 67-131]UKI08211.1 tripartite tricarboxylate transporter substrate bind
MYLPRVFTRSLAWCLCGLAVSAMAPALADTYPGKPITLVVGYPPGGSTDLTGRALGVELSHRLGVPVIVDNVGGAGGVIGAQKVVNAAPDGYTLLVGANNEIAISRLVNASVRYEPKDFTPIGLIASQPLVLVAAPAAGVKNAGEFLALLKKSPGRYSYGSSGVGTSLHLAGEMVKQQGGVAMTHVPYRGVAPLTNDLLGGNIDFGVFVLSSALPYIRSGKMVALGTTEAKRSAITPDLPALGETPALKSIDIGVWFALMGPAKMPEPVVARLRKALDETLQSPDFRRKMEATSSVVPLAPLDIERFLAAETAKYRNIVQFANIKE